MRIRALMTGLYAVAVAAALGLQAAPRSAAAADPQPILFVHGNGDSAALWYTTIWRFESNGYDRRLLSALDFAHPSARSDDSKPQPNRSGTEDQKAELGAAVTRIVQASRQSKVVLIASSRGGNAVRNFIRFGGGGNSVSAAILCGTPNHGVLALPVATGGEFNGAGPFLTRLNEGSEVYPGVSFTTIRSDKNDKYAQPTGEFLGMPGKPTQVTAAGPELKGANNIVIPDVDHRETAFHPKAFAAMFRTLTGKDPRTMDVLPEQQPVLNGMVSGFADGAPTNLPLSGASVTVYALNASTGERRGEPMHQTTTDSDGLWGPFKADPSAYHEFVVAASGYPVTHSYRGPFPRSSPYIHFRLRPPDPKLQGAGSVVTLIRPRGYLGHGRDVFTIDGKVPDGVNKGVPGTDSATMAFPAGPSRPVPVVLNQEKLTVRTYPLAEGHVVFAEFHY